MKRVALLAGCGVLLQTLSVALHSVWPALYVLPDVTLMVVLYHSLSDISVRLVVGRGGGQKSLGGLFSPEGAVLALGLGYTADLFSGGVTGALTLAVVIVYLTARLLGRYLELGRSFSQSLVFFASSLLCSLLIQVIYLGSGFGGGYRLVFAIFGQALLAALIAPPVFKLLELVDLSLAGGNRLRNELGA